MQVYSLMRTYLVNIAPLYSTDTILANGIRWRILVRQVKLTVEVDYGYDDPGYLGAYRVGRVCGVEHQKAPASVPGKPNDLPITLRLAGMIVGVVLVLATIGVACSAGQIGAGERGVVLKFGGVTSRTLNEGIYVVVPFVNSVERMSVQTDIFEAPASAASKDLQTVETTVALNYHLNPERVNDVYQTLRRDYVARIITPAVQESVKAVTATFDAEELITKRPQVKADIETALSGRLGESGVMLDTLSLTNFTFSETFANAIESKQVAA